MVNTDLAYKIVNNQLTGPPLRGRRRLPGMRRLPSQEDPVSIINLLRNVSLAMNKHM